MKQGLTLTGMPAAVDRRCRLAGMPDSVKQGLTLTGMPATVDRR
ncbi:hypothetical protein [Streptomyces sp. NPDC057280]